MRSPKRRSKKTPKKPATAKQQRETIRTLSVQLAILEAKTAAAQAAARRQIVAIARDMLPAAAGFARKGRPRLLAVCAKIVADPKLQANLDAVQKL